MDFALLISLATSIPTIEQIIQTAPTAVIAIQRLAAALSPSLLGLLSTMGGAFFPGLAPALHGLAGATSVSKLAVIGIQEALNLLVKPSPNLKIDGLMGPKTKAAVMALQAAHGLPSTGFLADAEWALIQSALAKL